MARTPRAVVSKTSGQGTGRYSYQNAYELGAKGTGAPGKNALRLDRDLSSSKSSRTSEIKPVDVDTKWNISYGDTWGQTWEEMKHKDKNKPPRGPKL